MKIIFEQFDENFETLVKEHNSNVGYWVGENKRIKENVSTIGKLKTDKIAMENLK